MASLGDIIYRGVSVWKRLVGNTTTTRMFLSQTGTGAASAAPAWIQPAETDLTFTDVTTNNSSTSKHGFLKKLSNSASEFMDGTGNWSTPAGAGNVTTTGSPANGNLTKFSGATSITNGDLSGDVTTSGTLATTLANSGVTAGDYGSVITTVDAKGRITAVSQNYLQYRDEKSQNTQGGTFTSGSWQTRTLNTEVSDVGGFGSLSSNQITLTAGTYRIYATAPAYLVARNQLRLQNVTDTTTLLIGQSCYTPSISSNSMVTFATLAGVFTIGSSKALEIQHQCQTTETTDGFGVAANFTTEVYTVVELWKIG